MPNEPPVSGSCFCGAVRFEVELPTLFCGHCHCSMCRRSNGAAFVTWFAVPIERFRLLDTAALVRHPSSDHGTRSFCGRCGSPLFCESSRHPERIDITLASMAGPIDRRPEAHYYYDCRAEWLEGTDALPKLGGPSGTDKL
ncbi:MAG TPA: GFA family protein [Thermoanaerobaculia bacterium]|nr:GFA family protein [Thermoanaerobaculia bacterium]